MARSSLGQREKKNTWELIQRSDSTRNTFWDHCKGVDDVNRAPEETTPVRDRAGDVGPIRKGGDHVEPNPEHRRFSIRILKMVL
jgi:hypothetical protein